MIAHRAGNSRLDARRAIESGAVAIEVDVHLFRGRVEARHARTIGPVPLLADRWWIGRHGGHDLLCDIIAEIPDSCTLVIDLKGRSVRLARTVRRLIEDSGRSLAVLVCARRWRLLDEFRNTPHVIPVHSLAWQWQLRWLERKMLRGSVSAVSMHARLVMSTRGLRVVRHVDIAMSWPINCEQRAQRMLDAGVVGCITDDVACILPTVNRAASVDHA